MKYLAAALLLALAVLGALYGYQRNALATLAAEQEQAALDATRAKRAALEAETKGRQEIARWRATVARHEAEVKRLRGQAVVAAREVKAVERAGERLVASGTTDEILAALRARGYHPARCERVGR